MDLWYFVLTTSDTKSKVIKFNDSFCKSCTKFDQKIKVYDSSNI